MPRPKAAAPVIVGVMATVGLAVRAVALGKLPHMSTLVDWIFLAVIAVSVVWGVIATWKARASSPPPSALPAPPAGHVQPSAAASHQEMKLCSRCGTEVQTWFVPSLIGGCTFGADPHDSCHHCIDGWPYPTRSDSEDEYVERLKTWRATERAKHGETS